MDVDPELLIIHHKINVRDTINLGVCFEAMQPGEQFRKEIAGSNEQRLFTANKKTSLLSENYCIYISARSMRTLSMSRKSISPIVSAALNSWAPTCEDPKSRESTTSVVVKGIFCMLKYAR